MYTHDVLYFVDFCFDNSVNQTDGECKVTETELAKLHPCFAFQGNSRSEHSSCKLWLICTRRMNTVDRLVSSSIQIAKRVCVYFGIAAIQKVLILVRIGFTYSYFT